jgi:hypothetical protein
MGCSVEESINEALRSCGACVATGAQRNWVLIQRADQTYASPNTPTTMKLAGEKIDAQGRVAHVRAMAFVGQASVTTAPGATPISAYNLRGACFTELKVQDSSGWDFIDGFDARTVLDEIWCRHYGKRAGFFGREHSAGLAGQPRMPAIGQDEGVGIVPGTANYDISWAWPFTRLDAEGNPLEGLVTLSSLQLAIAGGLRLRFGSTASIPGGAVGQTLNGYVRYDGSAGIDLWADIVYLPAVVADQPWNINHGVMQQQDDDLPHGDRRTELLALRYLPEDPNPLPVNMQGQTLAQLCTGMTFKVGGNAFMAGFSQLDMLTRGLLFTGSAPYGSHVTDNAAIDLPYLDASNGALIHLILPFAPRELAAAGTINVKATTRTPPFWRWLHRTVLCPDSKFVAARAARIYREAECGPCGGIFGTTPRGEKTGKQSISRPLILQPSRFMRRKA